MTKAKGLVGMKKLNKAKGNRSRRIISVILATILMFSTLASFAITANAANYQSKATVKISCKANKTYKYSASNDMEYCIGGTLTIKKGGISSADSVNLTQAAPTHSAAKIRYMRISLTTSDNKTNTIQTKWELLGNGNTKITTTKNGKASTVIKVGSYEFYKFQSISVSGTLWKAAKSVYASSNQTGGDGGSCYIYFNTK